MKLTIKGTNLKLTPAIYQYIDKKLNQDLEKLIKTIDSSVEAWVEVGRTTQHHRRGMIYRAEMQVRLPGDQTIRSEAEHLDLHLAIDTAKDELQQELKRYKEKIIAKYKRGARRAKKDLKLAPEARLYRKGRIKEEGV